MANKKDAKADLANHAAKMQKLYGENSQARESIFEIIDEAAVHLLEHFQTPFKHDYVFLMGKALFGTHRETGQRAHGMAIYIDGDIHEFAHDLCDEMKNHEDLKIMIFHAVELYLKRKIV